MYYILFIVVVAAAVVICSFVRFLVIVDGSGTEAFFGFCNAANILQNNGIALRYVMQNEV